MGDTPALRPKRSILDDKLMVKPGHRQAPNGLVTTVFGGTGFLGRATVFNYAHFGSQVMCPYRGDAKKVRDLRVMGDLGQIVPVPFNFYDKDSVARAMKTSHVVVNCVGRDVESGQWDFHDSHVKTAYRMAEAAREAGVDKFIHISTVGATTETECQWLKSKAEGEAAVREVLPDAIIVRCGPLFGLNDRFLNLMALMNNKRKLYPMVNQGAQRLQPVAADDVADALVSLGMLSGVHGKTFELTGNEVFTLNELQNLVRENIYLPALTAQEQLQFSEGWVFPDELWRQEHDFVASGDEDVLGFKDLLLDPASLQLLSDSAAIQLISQRDGRGPPRFGETDDDSDMWNSQWETSELSVAVSGTANERCTI